MSSKNRVIVYSLLLGIILYVVDAVLDYFIFAQDLTFIQVLITKVPLFEVYNRLLMIVGIILFGFLVSSRISDLEIENEFMSIKASGPGKVSRDTEFINNISYQVRTPLNAIVGFSELLKDPNLSAQSKQTYISHIHSSGNYLLQLINNMVDISRIEDGEMLLKLGDCNLNLLLDDLDSFFRERMKEMKKENIDFQIVKGIEGKDFVISTDRERFKQVLINLLENAFRYTEEGKVEIGYRVKEEDLLEFYVKDTGRGFSEDRLNLIFERYKKLTDYENQPFDGTALNLSISKSMVKLLGGNIWAHSKRGEGATFYFTIPFVTVKEEERTEKEPDVVDIHEVVESESVGWTNKLIMVAEDVESNFIYLQEILRPSGVNLLWVENGRQAVEKVKEMVEIDLILMDILMPEMDGYEAAKLIKEIRPNVPIIAQTAYSPETSSGKTDLENFDNYLIKPIWSPQLFEAISHYLGKAGNEH